MERIVVGIDGSDPSRAALRWAVDEARLRGAQLEVLLVAALPSTYLDPVIFPPPPVSEIREAERERLDQIIASVDTSGCQVEPIIAVGGAARLLVEASQGAALLVVGSRGFGGFKGLLLGSVAQQVMAHARCPVVVVRGTERHAHPQEPQEP